MARRAFGRKLSRVLTAVAHPARVLSSVYGIRLFRRPVGILRAYLTRTCPENRCIETRRGQKIFLTGDVDDLVTVLIVLGRGDYGSVPKNGVVIDVGAHLGSFSLYAAWQGASRVFSYEPDQTLIETFRRNLTANGLDGRVQANRAAVIGSGPSEVVFFPEGNASGHVGQQDESGGIRVPATTLTDIVRSNGLDRVDLLKLDCEGSEYGILFDTPDDIWSKIGCIRLEYHRGQTDRIRQRLTNLGFRLVRMREHTQNVGLMFFDREKGATRLAAGA